MQFKVNANKLMELHIILYTDDGRIHPLVTISILVFVLDCEWRDECIGFIIKAHITIKLV